MGSISTNNGGYDDDGDEQQRAGAECHSFTFMSCSDFTSSSLRFFSDCEGDESDSESYIEIELDGAGAKLDSEEEDEIELRVSISSSAPFPKLGSSSLQKGKNPGEELRAAIASVTLLGFSSSCSEVGIDGRGFQEESGNSGDQGRGGAGGAKFAAVSRLLNAAATSPKVSPEMCHEQDKSSPGVNRCQHRPRPNEASKNTRTRNGARVVQFLFKFRAIQFRTFLTSLVKNRPVLAKGKTLSESLGERRLQETLHFHHKMAKSTGRTMAETIASEKKTTSCPSSIKCSPINRETFNNTNRTQKGECSIRLPLLTARSHSPLPAILLLNLIPSSLERAYPGRN